MHVGLNRSGTSGWPLLNTVTLSAFATAAKTLYKPLAASAQLPTGPWLCLQLPCDWGWPLAGLLEDVSAGQLPWHRPSVAGTWTWTWSSTDHSSAQQHN